MRIDEPYVREQCAALGLSPAQENVVVKALLEYVAIQETNWLPVPPSTDEAEESKTDPAGGVQNG